MTVFRPAQLTKYRAAFQQPGARTVQKRAVQGSQSDVRQEFSKPKEHQMPRAVNEVSRSEKVSSLSVALTQRGLFKNELGKARKLNINLVLIQTNVPCRNTA